MVAKIEFKIKMPYNENINKIKQNMNISQLPNLDEIVLNSLNLFIKKQPPTVDSLSSFPIIIGSGNAYNAGQVIFGKKPALFANETNFRPMSEAIKPLIKKGIITQAIIISASGEKDSVWEIELAKKIKLQTILFTCNGSSSAAALADKVVVFDKLPEPYSYNTSTYLGMILGATKENPAKIKSFIKKLRLPKNFHNYSAYVFILPDQFGPIAPMLEIKRHELFGPHLSIRAFSYGEARHAKFINEWEKELVISLGKNEFFGSTNSRWEITLPAQANNGLVMALGYYLIGQIQATKKSYFKKNISHYCQKGPLAYGQKEPFNIIV